MKKYLVFIITLLLAFPVYAGTQKASASRVLKKNIQSGILLDIKKGEYSLLAGKGECPCKHKKRCVSNDKQVYSYIVQVDKTAYEGQYTQYNELQFSPLKGYKADQPIKVRFEGKKKMLVERPNGKFVKTKIVKKWEVAAKKPEKKKKGR